MNGKCAAVAAWLCAVALAGCSAEVTTGEPSTVSRSDLESKVEGMYTPDDPDATIEASCAGDLDAEEDATQDCHLTVGEESADVRVTVTSVEDGDTRFETVPFVPADRIAAAVKSSLAEQGYRVSSVDCADELMGEKGATVACTATASSKSHDVDVKVTRVRGLIVNFNYRVVR